MNEKVDANLRYLEDKIDKAINLINVLQEENRCLKNILESLKHRDNQLIEKINIMLDNLSKML